MKRNILSSGDSSEPPHRRGLLAVLLTAVEENRRRIAGTVAAGIVDELGLRAQLSASRSQGLMR
ncbi:SufE family protein [Shigella flexneri]